MKNTLAIILAFIIGFLFCISYSHRNLVEGFDVMPGDCPTVLIQEGNQLMLLNRLKARIPGVNPIMFDNLEDYVEYLKWQRNNGTYCPVLYFQGTYDTQGNKGFRALPDPLQPNAGLPSTIPDGIQPLTITKLQDANIDTDPPFNSGGYPAYDPMGQNNGLYTPLDKMFHKIGPSSNPMDNDWTGN